MKQKIKLNASGLKTTTCMYNFWNVCIEGYKTERSAAKMVYGIAVHKYIDTMFQTKGHIGKAREAALVAFRKPKAPDKKSNHMNDENHLMATCYSLWENYVAKDEAQTVLLPMINQQQKLHSAYHTMRTSTLMLHLKGRLTASSKSKVVALLLMTGKLHRHGSNSHILRSIACPTSFASMFYPLSSWQRRHLNLCWARLEPPMWEHVLTASSLSPRPVTINTSGRGSFNLMTLTWCDGHLT